MRVLIINSVSGIRSTGRIVKDIADNYISEGHECKIAFGRETAHPDCADISYRIGNEFNVRINALKARLLDNEGLNAVKETKKFIKWADEYNPDILWLHNLHGYYINIELLFDWIKSRPQMEVKWTLHDCWAFTGHCAHFSYMKCYKWKHECSCCIQKREYPASYFIDACKNNYQRKKSAFCGVNQMTIITPSEWLANLVRQSFLREYSVQVIHNTINNRIFKPTISSFREKHNLKNKKIILGVASAWGKRKGLDDFVKLSGMLDDTYQIVLVGLTKKQIKKVPHNCLCIQRTHSLIELAEIYSAADVYVNLSYEETFGLTILEAIACGTNVIVYSNTACEEVANMYGGNVVEQGDLISVSHIIEAVSKI